MMRMGIEKILPLFAIAVLPVAVSLLMNSLLRRGRLAKLTYMQKQVIVGVIFGILAIGGTEFGVPVEGAVMNARDAAPLCAGLIFGGPAGLIAGLIGGIERWFASYWGAGYYTRLACSISTCLTGLLAAFLRKYQFEDKIPSWDQALAAGFEAEIFHMIMIFVTNMSSVRPAFNYVRLITIPMVAVNTLAVTLAVVMLNLTDKTIAEETKAANKTLTVITERALLRIVAAAFLATTAFGYYLESQISSENIRQILYLSIQDASRDIMEQFNEIVLHTNRLAAAAIKNNPNSDLENLAEQYNVYQINVIDQNGIVTGSSNPDYIGTDIRSDTESEAFLRLLTEDGQSEIVQDLRLVNGEDPRYLKYSAVKTDTGMIQIICERNMIINEIELIGNYVVSNRRAGETGAVMILDQNNEIVGHTADVSVYNLINTKELDGTMFQKDYPGIVHRLTAKNNVYYYIYEPAEKYALVSILPAAEGDFEKDLSAYLNVFMQTIVYGMLFVVISRSNRKQIAENIRRVNDSLEDITAGKLDTKVEVNATTEFEQLSEGVNTTVDSLKRYIAEANARIDTELEYAREIQTSALPSHFPAFPNRNEIDIYALMKPAKEVGGDFYDFYFIDEKHLAFAIADVSGKGIPAALFMMRSKTLLKTYATYGIAVADIFTNGNYQLGEENDADMFVTAWMGILNLETGELKYANAGHNRPLLRRKDGTFEYLKGPAGMVLAGVKNMVYKEQTLMLEPGDELFLYTDGVVEAKNADGEMYGDDRLNQSINRLIGKSAEETCKRIRQDVEEFYEGAPQFDDMTELMIRFRQYWNQN